MNILKKLLIVCTIIIMACSTVEAVAAEKGEEVYTCYNSVINYGQCPKDKQVNSTKYVKISAFDVSSEGKIILLSAGEKKIITYNNLRLDSTLDISCCVDPQFLVWDGNRYIIFDLADGGCIFYLNTEGRVVQKDKLPGNVTAYNIAGFYLKDGAYCLITYDKELIDLNGFDSLGNVFSINNEDGIYSVTYGDITWRFPVDSSCLYNPVFVNDENCLYIEKTTIAENTNVIQGETYLLKVGANGEELASMRLRLEEYVDFPNQYYKFCNDNLYILELFEDGSQISNVMLGTKREISRIDEIEQKYAVNNVALATKGHTVTRSREVVLNYAVLPMNASWVLNSGNKTVVSNDTQLPQYISNALIGQSVTGIPYCWGGYDSSVSNIISQLNSGAMAGNVKHNVVSGPVGFDCSGYVSYCYGLGTHIKTSDMLSSVNLNAIPYTSMQSMDLIHKDGHVMLFSHFPGNNMIVYEATPEGDQKTRIHILRILFL